MAGSSGTGQGKMDRQKLKFSVIILLLLSLFLSIGQAEVFEVFPGESVKDGLDRSGKGDTLWIHGGYFYEHDIEIVKPVTMIGEDSPIIDGEGKYHILTIRSDSVNIRGMAFRNAGISFINENAAIKLSDVSNCSITGNRFENNFFAIYLANASDCVISQNQIRAESQRETNSGNGIHLWYCRNIYIDSNTITGHRDGIYMEFVEEAEIVNNQSEHNLRYGLHFMFSNSCKYNRNIFRHNGAGVAVMYTRSVIMTENQFEENTGPASYGLLLKDIRDSRIENNIFRQNSVGLYTEASNRISIRNNLFQNNGWAVKIMANSMDNAFTRNDFIGNAFDVATNSRQNFNIFDGNYWSRYKGYDLDRDGTGELPFRPVRLFALIVENEHTSLVLLKSFFIDLLDLAESIFPVLIPETLIDHNPQMKRIL
jgi:nitrous oxidase accessory protein